MRGCKKKMTVVALNELVARQVKFVAVSLATVRKFCTKEEVRLTPRMKRLLRNPVGGINDTD